MSDDRRDPAALTLRRLVAAPRVEVFRAWTEPEALARWWWPFRFRTADLLDLGVLAVGGAFIEIRTPERLVYTWAWEGAEEEETVVTVAFRDRGHRRRCSSATSVSRMSVPATSIRRDGLIVWSD